MDTRAPCLLQKHFKKYTQATSYVVYIWTSPHVVYVLWDLLHIFDNAYIQPDPQDRHTHDTLVKFKMNMLGDEV